MILGKTLDLETIPRFNTRNQRAVVADNPFSATGNAGMSSSSNKDSDHEYKNPWLKRWIATSGSGFRAADFVSDCFDPADVVNTDAGKVSVPCPNIDSHSMESKTGFVAQNFDYGDSETFALYCSHDGCDHLNDRLIWLDMIIDEFDITEDNINEYVDEFEGDELEDETGAGQEESRFAGKLTYPPRKTMTLEEHREWVKRQLQDINEEFAIVAHNNKLCVLREPKGSSNKDFHFWALSDLRLHYKNCPILMKYDQDISKDVMEDAYKMWTEWSGRREFDGIEFQPDLKKAKPKFFNTFRGFATEPDSNGSWSELRQHLKSAICHDNDEWFHWVMTWLAHIVQKPGEKINTCLVIRGAQGTGKSTLGEFIIEMLGNRVALMVDDPSAITGNFTGQLSGKLFILDEEATFPGYPQAANKMKSILSGKYLHINEKFLNPRQEENFLRIMKLTNDDWAVPKEIDDRRYTVLEIKPDHAQDIPYFAAIRDQMNNEGGLGAMMHELMNWKPSDEYSGWDCIRTPLQTVWGEEQTEMSADLLDMFITEFLEKGVIETKFGHDPIPAQPYIAQGGGNPFIKPGDLLKFYQVYCRENANLGRPSPGSTRTPVALMNRLKLRLTMEKCENTSRTATGSEVVKGTIYEITDPGFGSDK